jgi:hypothetical protein
LEKHNLKEKIAASFQKRGHPWEEITAKLLEL